MIERTLRATQTSYLFCCVTCFCRSSWIPVTRTTVAWRRPLSSLPQMLTETTNSLCRNFLTGALCSLRAKWSTLLLVFIMSFELLLTVREKVSLDMNCCNLSYGLFLSLFCCCQFQTGLGSSDLAFLR